MSDDEVVKAGIKAALKARRLNKKNGVILETEFERAAIAAYKERLRQEIRSELVEVNILLQNYRDTNEINGAIDMAGVRDGLQKALTLIEEMN